MGEGVQLLSITAEVFPLPVGQAATTTTPGHIRPDCLLPSSVAPRHVLAPPPTAEVPKGPAPQQPRFPPVFLTGTNPPPTTGVPAGGLAAGGETPSTTPATVGNYGEDSEAEPCRKRRKMSTVSMDSASTAGEEEVCR